MTRIVVTQPMRLSEEQRIRLEKLGEVKYYEDVPASPDEWLKRTSGADVICSGIFGLRDVYDQLKNVFVSVPFVGVGSFADPTILKGNNVTLCNSPGSNKYAVSEWIIFMIIETMRDLAHYINSNDEPAAGLPPYGIGLHDRNITILGKGNIGLRVGTVCEALGMKVKYFKRGDDLAESVEDADVVVDVLTANPTTMNILNKDFFDSMKNGSTFISVTVDSIVNIQDMIEALDKGKLRAAAYDVMNAGLGDTSDELFVKLKNHPKIKATPHISGFSDTTNKDGNNIMISNIESWKKGKPINVFGE
jgi:phosphoglycerate dehydrogenase-like enzyme